MFRHRGDSPVRPLVAFELAWTLPARIALGLDGNLSRNEFPWLTIPVFLFLVRSLRSSRRAARDLDPHPRLKMSFDSACVSWSRGGLIRTSVTASTGGLALALLNRSEAMFER